MAYSLPRNVNKIKAMVQKQIEEDKESVDEHEICDEYLTEKEQQQLLLDEYALIETIEEEAMDEKEWEERIRQE
uniref:Uncharacterized protein n=1 Tax=Tanacetum cinerariifolium TaxID=118510 RepID=A0A6L2JD63_TANCI|nr:hypothetical protein [Tanacetum cinerariifolium]